MTGVEYSSCVLELLEEDRLPALGPGRPNDAMRDKLQALSFATMFDAQEIHDRTMADACLSALWLYHDFLDESHTISQDIATPTGSYWHGIMHRREPDFSNSAYWFRRVGNHPIFADLCRAAADIAGHDNDLPAEARFLTEQKDWDPFAFIDLCEGAYRGRNECATLCRQIQKREWELLFDYCYRRALGT